MEENASELMLLDFFFLNIGNGLQCVWVQNSDPIMCYWECIFERQEEPGADLQVEGITPLIALYCPLEYFLGVWLTLRRVMEGWTLLSFSYWSLELEPFLTVNTAPCTVMWWSPNVEGPVLVAWELYAALKVHKAEGSKFIQQD